jgi:UDP-glucose 6-dehydrogenase
VPGPDGELSYGGMCFPKDTLALLYFLKNNNVQHSVVEATINERNTMRNDNINIL